MAITYVDQFDLEGKRVVARFDFNVPLDKNDSSKITDTTRIDRALPTIEYILEQGASKLVLMSHLGRPEGKANPKYSLEPVATYLAEKLGTDVVLTESATDRGIKQLLELGTTKIVLLQNLRFDPGETKGDLELARQLSTYGDIFVNDAFGTAHREHASTYTIVNFFKGNALGGFLLRKEIEALEKVVNKPASPFVAIVGGAKVSDKIKIIESLLSNVDNLLIGGAMAYPFLKAKGIDVGKSLCGVEDVELAKQILLSSSASKILLPQDHIISNDINGTPSHCDSANIPDSMLGLDIGPSTITQFCSKLKDARTILWNGPMGLFENEAFSKGTFAIANALSENKGFTLVGGGDSVSAVMKSGVANKITHVSTGGGASLEYIENGTLPGIQALKFGLNL